MIINEMNLYIRNIIKTICKTKEFKAVISDSTIYILLDKTQLIYLPLVGKIPLDLITSFDEESLKVSPDYIMDANHFEMITNKVIYYRSIILSMNPAYVCENLREDQQFQNYITRKASDGASFYFMDVPQGRVPISVFSSLFNLNKADTIGVELYLIGEYSEGCICVAVFHIYKANLKLKYDLYMRIMGL